MGKGTPWRLPGEGTKFGSNDVAVTTVAGLRQHLATDTSRPHYVDLWASRAVFRLDRSVKA